jgi:thioredoxin 1
MELLTDQNFDSQVLDNQKPVVVAFMTPTCPNCTRLKPTYQATAEENIDKAAFFELNAHDYLDVAKKYKVMAVPTLLYFRHGILVNKQSGVKSRNSIEKVIDQIKDYTPADAEDNQYKSFLQKIFGR